MRVDIEQNTSEWTEWRKKGVNASEAPVIMGDPHPASKAKSWSRLRIFKNGGYPQANFFEESAFEYGHKKESEARIRLKSEWGTDYEPQCHEVQVSGLSKPLQASIDGVRTNGDDYMPRFIEVKSVRSGKAPALSIMQKENRIPPFVRWQMLQQAIAIGLKETEDAAYVVIDGMGRIFIMKIKGRELYENDARTRLISRWEEFIKGEHQSSVDQVKLQSYLDPYKKTKLKFDAVKTRLDRLKKELLTFLDGCPVKNEQGVSVVHSSVARVNMSALLEHLWQRLEQGGLTEQYETLARLKKKFEGKPTGYWKILIDK